MIHRTACIISVGDELVLGQTLDTNSRWLSAALLDRGVVVRRHVTVADDAAAIAAELRLAAGHCELLIVTGGLGPTADDLTRHGLAEALGAALVTDEAALEQIRARFAALGRPMPKTNESQALRPATAAVLANDHGTAPGLHAAIGAADVFCLPGPPREMQPMFDRFVAPAINTDRVVITRLVRTVGIGESVVAERLGPLMDRARTPLIGTTASGGAVTCRIRYEGESREEAEREVSKDAAAVREALGAYVFGEGEPDVAAVVVRELVKRGKVLTTAESCTGGLLAGAFTEIPGVSGCFRRGVVTYSNESKVDLARVPSWIFDRAGAVSRTCVEAMGRGALDLADADYALAITGIAGPDGSTPDKPVGTVWICLAVADGSVDVRHFRFPGDRAQIRARAVTMAIAMLWLRLVRAQELPLLGQVEQFR
jgi:nicotinamide-nucleotide amidase